MKNRPNLTLDLTCVPPTEDDSPSIKRESDKKLKKKYSLDSIRHRESVITIKPKLCRNAIN